MEKINETGKLIFLPVGDLYPHPDNPRKVLGDLSELAESIKSKGVKQNLTVVPRQEGGYTVIIGHRRSAAAKLAGLESVPCAIVEMSEREQVATMLLENMQRVDLTAYEQAAGFQMMMDLGESVESISKKTGFSKKTIRGRLKMAELDAELFRSVSAERQLTIGDLEKIGQIENIEKRNELLKVAGTNNFEQAFTRALKQQTLEAKMPLVTETVKNLNARKLDRCDTYTAKYIYVCGIRLEDVKDKITVVIPKKHEGQNLFYYFDDFFGELKIYVMAPKAEPVKRSPKEIAREKTIQEAHDTLTVLESEAYDLRVRFVAGLRVTKDNVDAVREGAFLALLCEQHWYNSHVNKRDIYENLAGVQGMKDEYYTDKIFDIVSKAYRDAPKRMMPFVIYASFGDGKGEGFHTTYKREYPKYQKNRKLCCLYEWLASCGYEMSDDERMLVDGTHPIFEDKKGTQNE